MSDENWIISNLEREIHVMAVDSIRAKNKLEVLVQYFFIILSFVSSF